MKAFKECCISNSIDGTEDVIVWEHFVQPRETTGNANHDTDKVDFREENAMYHQIPQPYNDEEYQRMWISEDSDQEFDGFSPVDVDDERCN